MKRILVSLALALVPFGIGWLGGMELVRGPNLALTAGLGIGVFLVSYSCPMWWDE